MAKRTSSLEAETKSNVQSLCNPNSILDITSPAQHLTRSYSNKVFYGFWFIALNAGMDIIPIPIWGFWLAKTEVFGSLHSFATTTTCLVTHVALFFYCTFYWRRALRLSPISRREKVTRALTPLLQLLPIPFPLLSTALLFKDSTSKTITKNVFDRYHNGERQSLWNKLEESVKSSWAQKAWTRFRRRTENLKESEAIHFTEAHISSFFRLKTFLLSLDAAMSIALVFSITNANPSWSSFLGFFITPILYFSIIWIGLGVLIQTGRGLGQIFCSSRRTRRVNAHPYGAYFFSAGFASTVGLIGELLLIEGQEIFFSALLAVAGLFFGPFTFTLLLRPPQVKIKSVIASGALWIPLLQLICFLGLDLLKDVSGLNRVTPLLETAMLLTPLWSIGLFCTLGGWLLRPFSWQHIFNPNLPYRLRTTLAIVTLTSALPLGGLAIPFWIYARHRIWPRYEPLLGQAERG